MPAATAEAEEKLDHTDNRRVGTVAWKLLRDRHPDWSVDELLIHPVDAINLCQRVNARMATDRPIPQILRALVNARKRGAAIGTARKSRR